QECEAEVGCRERGMPQDLPDAARQEFLERLKSDLGVVRRAFGVRGEHLARLIDQEEQRLAAAAIHTQVSSHDTAPERSVEGANDRGSGPPARRRPGASFEGYITTIMAPVEIPPSHPILTLRPGRRVDAEVAARKLSPAVEA